MLASEFYEQVREILDDRSGIIFTRDRIAKAAKAVRGARRRTKTLAWIDVWETAHLLAAQGGWNELADKLHRHFTSDSPDESFETPALPVTVSRTPTKSSPQ